MKDLALLETTQTDAMRAPEFQPDQPAPGTTHCNAALRKIASAFGYDFPDEMANDMIERLFKEIAVSPNPRWSLARFEGGVTHALGGGLAVLAKKFSTHGHVATIMPMKMSVSPTLKTAVPIVANIGKENGPLLASRAFPVMSNGKLLDDWMPQCFVLDA